MQRENSTPLKSTIASRRPLFGVLLLALVVRTGILWADFGGLSADVDNYRQIAENLRRTGVFGSVTGANGEVAPTAFRPPLYPLLLASLATDDGVSRASVAMLHLAIGLLSVALLWRLAVEWLDLRGAVIACGLFIVDPILLNQSARVMTETLATLLAIAGLWTLTRLIQSPSVRRAAVAGTTLGLACLCRPTFLPWAAICQLTVFAIAAFPDRAPRTLVIRWSHGATILIGFAATMAPWMIRNQAVFGRPIYATTHGGYTLLLANNDSFYQHLRTRPFTEVWDARQLQDQLPPATGGELAADARDYRLARDTIRRQPGMFVYSALHRVAMFWSPLPHRLTADESAARRWARLAVAAWYLAVSAAAAVGVGYLTRQALRGGIAKLLDPPWLFAALLLVTLTAVHAVYWSNMRMRAPLVPVVSLLAAAGFGAIFDAAKKKRGRAEARHEY
ncbi:MAG: glycosyltransferase family 39 protein [Planctomycetales bacterium]|nr:glycosyltransferase family 39 protein [Planctomycetales bacterium]